MFARSIIDSYYINYEVYKNYRILPLKSPYLFVFIWHLWNILV
jgi:hypothetical protein